MAWLNDKILFGYKKVLIILSVILVVALFFVIRGSSWPLISDNMILKLLFYSDNEADHTFYNIAISYVAAYLFYFIQVFYPEYKKTKIAIVQTKADMYNCLRQCKIFVEGWKALLIRDPQNGSITGIQDKVKYYEDPCGNIIQITKDSLNDTKGRILEAYDRIKNHHDFRNSDLELQKLFLDMDFAEQAKEWYVVLLSAELLCSTPNPTIQESYSEDDLAEFQLRILRLAMIYKIEECVCLEETTDKEKIKAYQKRMHDSYRIINENQEYFKNLPKGYGESVRY
ncbi:MAG: hypothetical protein LUG93_12665 [Lachnospiraceae bacterium]|nr:hypothetical protein [Lachnospiraceae bacterium]